MMPLIKRMGCYALVLFCTLFIWSICLASAQKVQHLQSSMELRYHEPTLTLTELEKIQKEEAKQEKRLVSNLVAWEQKMQVELTNKDLDKSAKSTIIYVFGDMRSLIPNTQVTGEFVYEGDYKGALITKKVAYDLWGSLDVIDKTFTYENKEYVVRGLLDEEVPAIIVQLDQSSADTVQMSQLRVEFIEIENIWRQLELFRGRYGLGDTTTINLSLISIVLCQIIYLPMWIMGIGGLLKLYKLLYETYRYWVAALILGAGIVVVTGIILKLMTIQFNIPSYLVPNQWSDFAFWSNLWEEIHSNYLEVQSLPKYLPDVWRESIIYNLVSTWVISNIATIWGIKKIQVRDSKELFIQVLIAILASFITIMISYGIGIRAIVPQAFWSMVPMFMGIKYVCSHWKRLLK